MLLFCLKSLAGRAFAVLFFLLGTFTISMAAALADEQGWVLTQRSDKIGDQYVYVAPSGVKLVNPKIGYNIVLCAPDWNVCIYNDKNKTFYSASYGAWMQEVNKAVGAQSSELKGGHWAKSEASVICGLKATSYIMHGGGASHRGMRNATCWVSNDIVVPPQITQLLAQTYGLPDNKAYPLKLNTVDNSGKLSVQLDTYNSKPCAIPTSYFYLPTGYTRVASKEEVMIDDETKAILRDLASDSPGMGSSSSAQSPVARAPRARRRQQTYQQPTSYQPAASQVAQPTQVQQAQAQPTQAAATPGVITLPNGQTLDREKMRKIIEAIRNGGKTQTPTPTQTP